jgi:diacylglycerol kinase family enzyme
MARMGLMINPTSGKNTGAQVGQQALSLLRDAGVDVLDLSASDARSAVEQGRAAIGSGAIDRLVVGGGDGMVHLGANLCAGTPVSLGVIAAGTGNDIARELGLPVRDAAASVQRILSSSTRQVDAARHTTATGEQKWFLGASGCSRRCSRAPTSIPRSAGRARFAGQGHRLLRRRRALRPAADEHGGRARRAHRPRVIADVA